jgi:hypothetical protein
VKIRVHSDDVRVLQARVDLDLPLKLSDRPLLDERLLRHALQHERAARHIVRDFEHLPEATRPNQPATLARNRKIRERELTLRARLEQRVGVARARRGAGRWKRRSGRRRVRW